MKTAKTILVTLASVGVLAAATSAQAIVYDITSDHATGGLGTPPFGTVQLIQNGANLDVTVALGAGYSFVLTGAADMMDFKFNAVGVALGDITIDAHTPTLVAQTGAFNGDGTGQFVFGITGVGQSGGGSGAFTGNIVFHVANASIADLTQPNNLGIIFVADLLSPNGNTGPADVSQPGTSVPDGGSTLTLLGAALAGLGVLKRRIK
jgi:hypothetical protein